MDQSLDDLNNTRDAISADRKQLAAAGIDVTLIGQQVRKNSVVVGVMEITDKARQTLGQYGDNVSVIQQTPGLADACAGIGDCPPTKSGIKILAEEEGFFCTAGYLAKRTDVSPSKKIIVTAGHCLEFSGPPNPREWRHHGDAIGDEWNALHTWADDSYADVGMIRVDDLQPTVWNEILYKIGPPIGVGRITSYTGFQIEEAMVCRVGAGQGGRRCGVILRTGDEARCCEYVWTNCVWIQNINVADFDSTGGDSGGPVYLQDDSHPNSTVLYGTHVHSGPDDNPDSHSWYSEVGWGLFALEDMHGVELTVCLTSSC